MASLQELSKGALIKRYEHARNHKKKVAAQGDQLTQKVTEVVVTAGAAYAIALASRKFGGSAGLKVGGIPAEILIGVGAVGVALLGVGGPTATHVATSVGAGALAAFAANMGKQHAAAGLLGAAAAGEEGEGLHAVSNY